MRWTVLDSPWRVLSCDDLLISNPTMAAHTAAPPIPMPPMPSTMTPIFKACGSAYEPCPPILPCPINAAWVMPLALTTGTISNMCECLACQWEAVMVRLPTLHVLPNPCLLLWLGPFPNLSDRPLTHLGHRPTSLSLSWTLI